MRLIIVVDDADRDTVLATRDNAGSFLFVGLGHRMCQASVVGEAIPQSYTMKDGRGKACYDFTLLEVMTSLSVHSMTA